MTFVTETDYYDKFDNVDIKGVLPLARTLAISRPVGFISTIEVFCAVVFEDAELEAKLNERYGITQENLREYLKENLHNEGDDFKVDEFEELQITPRLDRAFRNALIGRGSISSKELLHVILSDEDSAVIDFLIEIGVISYSKGNVHYVGFRPFGEVLESTLKEFREYMLGEEW